MKKLPLRCLCEAAILIALAQILGYLKVGHMPLGGSITLSMLPLAVFCWRWGWKPGFLACFVFGLLQLLLDVAYTWGWQSILGDYLLAYTLLGLAGLFSQRKNGLFWGLLLGAFCRFLAHLTVGALVWAAVTPAAEAYSSYWLYSLAYNGPYMGGSTLLCLLAALPLQRPLKRWKR